MFFTERKTKLQFHVLDDQVSQNPWWQSRVFCCTFWKGMIFNDVFILKLMSRSAMVILTIQYYMKLFILTNTIYYWMRLITMWRMLQIKENAIHQSWRSTGITASEICIILYYSKAEFIKKYIVFIVIQNISKFLMMAMCQGMNCTFA